MRYTAAMLKTLTPILIVDSIEAQLPFYEGSLGFVRVMEVAHAGAIGFIGLVREERMVMLQTRLSLAADLPECAQLLQVTGGALLYAEVESLEQAVAAVGAASVMAPKRETFYGMREVWVRDPFGNVIGFGERIVPV